jgi:biopolymer transport protein ExbD
MRLVITLTAIFIFIQSCRNCDCPPYVSVSNPKPRNEGKIKQNIVVSIDNEQKLSIDGNNVDKLIFDSLLAKVITMHKVTIDTPTVTIKADSVAHYGVLLNIMRTAKRQGAKVVAQIITYPGSL